jgi:hypothetical protein
LNPPATSANALNKKTTYAPLDSKNLDCRPFGTLPAQIATPVWVSLLEHVPGFDLPGICDSWKNISSVAEDSFYVL